MALALPDSVAEGLLMLEGGVPGARWSTREQLHMTLRFIGEVDGSGASAIDDALATIRAPRFALELKGVGEFGSRNPRALWTGVRDAEPVLHLQRKIESAVQRIGLPAEERKFVPHVTLARLRGAPRERIITFLAAHALYASGSFDVNAFILYSSVLSANGSLYRPERAYRLE
ncbi:MAG TPA: RNA 2',3'-cyclic phosphodiesterase [Candidatus Binataceae bacterium]